MRERFSRIAFALLVNVVYGVAMPLLARLSMPLGLLLAARLGQLNARIGLDWRTVWQKEQDVARRTRQSLNLIRPRLSPARARVLLRQRFRYAALEDLEGHWLGLRRPVPAHSCTFEGLDAVQEALSHGKGIVLLTMHFDASILGIALLGQAGLTLNPMASDVFDDQQIPFLIRRYFRRKYAGLNSFLNGGRVSYMPQDLARCYRALRGGEGVVILGDAPSGDLQTAVPVDFFGRQLAFAPGFLRLAEKSHAPMAAFVCLRDGQGGYRITFSPVSWPVAGKHKDNVASLYAFLENCVSRYPGRWWAADLLTYFLKMDSSRDEHNHSV